MRWPRRCLTVLVTLLLLIPALVPARQAQPAPAEKTVRLGTWNIEWLGNAAKRKREGQKPDDIAKYIMASKVDLLGLNEITHDVDGEEPRNKTLNEALAIIKENTGKTWKHVLFNKENDKEKDQLCGVAWNDDVVKLVDKPFRVPIRRSPRDGNEYWRRHPYAVKFSFGDKKTDVVLIPVHMKSNSGGGVTKQSKVRAREAEGLLRALAAVQNHFSDDDIVVLGDVNCLLREEPALVRFRTSGFRDLNFADELSWIKERIYDPAPFDRILVPDDQPEFKGASFTVFKGHHLESEAEYRKKLSDHYMVYTEVKVMDDDD